MTTTDPFTFPSPSDVAELDALDRRHLVRSMHRGDIADRVIIVRGKGCTVWDVEGNALLDAAGGGVWHSPIGHGREDLAEVAAKQIMELEFFTSLLEFSNDKAIKLAARLVELAPKGLNRVAFSSGGSEAVETAIKAARLFHFRSGRPEKTWIISRHYSFHGAAYGSGSATGFPPMHHGVGPNLPNMEKISPATTYRGEYLYGGEDATDWLVRELEETIERIGAENIAAMIGEPIMAGGGVLAPPPGYWPRVREVLTENGILLIADEVVTAFGRTGTWFESERLGMKPDMITAAKGIAGGYAPLGATLMTDEIADAVISESGFFHGYTFQGHPVACALGLATLDIIEKEGLVLKADLIAAWFKEGLAPVEDLAIVGDLRIEGSLAAMELIADPMTTEPVAWPVCEKAAFEIRKQHGVIVRPYGHNLVLAPPLVISEEETARATAAVVDVLSRLSVDGTLAPRQ